MTTSGVIPIGPSTSWRRSPNCRLQATIALVRCFSMAKMTVADIDVTGKKVLMRCDFNVPLDETGVISSDDRILKALPSIRTVLDGGGSLILMSHLGRPKGERNLAMSLAPVARRLSDLLDQEVVFVSDCVGPDVRAKALALKKGDVLLLENLRFHKQETVKDKEAAADDQLRGAKDAFARDIAELADVYVCEAFGTAHRDNASMLTVPRMMAGKPRVAGLLIEKEIKFLSDTIGNPERPFVAVLGGAKVSDKIGVIENMLDKCDAILIGGAMMYTFAAAQGRQVGNSLVDPDSYDMARSLVLKGGRKLRLPVDCVAAKRIEEGIDTQVCTDAIPEGL
ncbi:MAG: phosphoglycerate kinase, partial [Planctomycetes bacterium]|nr:phosphoglycerate kinase [Planctomycetota bacterium]